MYICYNYSILSHVYSAIYRVYKLYLHLKNAQSPKVLCGCLELVSYISSWWFLILGYVVKNHDSSPKDRVVKHPFQMAELYGF